ncbi:MAG: amino acid ABC transporter permease [Clostridia bacterium]
MSEWFSDLKAQFILNFIDDDRWRYLLDGLGVTLEITVFALLIGLTIGITVAIIRATHDNTIETMNAGPGKAILKILNIISKIYLTVVRGTPVVVQLLIMYYIIFATSNNKIIVAVIAFGVNSGAYVAEIVRSGIMSIDKGQMEAGRSLGFNYVQTMISIIIPQAFKNVLPALANEFITLLKETSVSGYIALQDLTKGAYIIIGRTYSAFMPLIAVALIYLTLVMFFTWLVGKLERRLRNSDH